MSLQSMFQSIPEGAVIFAADVMFCCAKALIVDAAVTNIIIIKQVHKTVKNGVMVVRSYLPDNMTGLYYTSFD